MEDFRYYVLGLRCVKYQHEDLVILETYISKTESKKGLKRLKYLVGITQTLLAN